MKVCYCHYCVSQCSLLTSGARSCFVYERVRSLWNLSITKASILQIILGSIGFIISRFNCNNNNNQFYFCSSRRLESGAKSCFQTALPFVPFVGYILCSKRHAQLKFGTMVGITLAFCAHWMLSLTRTAFESPLKFALERHLKVCIFFLGQNNFADFIYEFRYIQSVVASTMNSMDTELDRTTMILFVFSIIFPVLMHIEPVIEIYCIGVRAAWMLCRVTGVMEEQTQKCAYATCMTRLVNLQNS